MPSETAVPLGQILLAEPFLQTRPLTAKDFVDHCIDRGIRMNMRLLERMDLEGFAPPILRVHKEKTLRAESTRGVYSALHLNISTLRLMRERGLVKVPDEEAPRPWKEYRDGHDEAVVPLYHPSQTLLVEPVQWLDEVTFGDSLLTAGPEDVIRRVGEARKSRDARVRGLRDAVRHREGLLRLLIRLENAFLPDLRGSFSVDPTSEFPDWYAQWAEWRRALDFSSIIKECGWSTETVRRSFESWSMRAMNLDPMGRWYLLVRNIKNEKRSELRGDALLAQDSYDVAMMLKWAYEHATGESLPEPDDLNDAMGGLWKERWYGSRNVFEDRTARLRLLTEFGLKPIYRVYLILEGETETTFVPILVRAMGIDFEAIGVKMVGLDGAQKANRGRLEVFLHHVAESGAVAYVILDNDPEVVQHTADLMKRRTPASLPLLREEFLKIWGGEFEDDNFSAAEVAEAFNGLAQSLGSAARVTAPELEAERQHALGAGTPVRITKILKRMGHQRGLDLDGNRVEFARKLAEIAVREFSVLPRASPRPIEQEILKIAELSSALESGAFLE